MQADWWEDMPDELADGEAPGRRTPHRLVGDVLVHCVSERIHSATGIVHYRAMAH